MLAIWHDVAAGQRSAVDEWYSREHHFERLAVPGFVQARRYERVSGQGADLFGAYRLSSPEVLHSAAYRARVNAPTESTRAAMRHFMNMSRTECRIVFECGRAHGGHVAALASADGADLDFGALCTSMIDALGVVRATAAQALASTHSAASAEQALRGAADTRIQWALLIEAHSQAAAERVLERALALTACRQAQQCAVYRLCFAASG